MDDLFLLLKKETDNESLVSTLNGEGQYGLVKSFKTWDLSVQIQTPNRIWDFTRLDKSNNGKWDLSDEENDFLEQHKIKDVICFSYPHEEKQKTLEILAAVLKNNEGFIAKDDDFNEDNLFSLDEFIDNYETI